MYFIYLIINKKKEKKMKFEKTPPSEREKTVKFTVNLLLAKSSLVNSS